MTLPAGLRCIGIDLAWSSARGHPSGVAALAPGARGLEVRELGCAVTDDEILAFVERHRGACSVIMVDAPLRVPNASGRRRCEDLVHARFGAREGGAHASNRTLFERLYGGVRGERLAGRLAGRGVCEGPLEAAGHGHHVYECYPHAAMLELFALPRTLKYKKKRQPWDEARAAFREVLAHLAALREPALVLEPALLAALEPGVSVGKAYKAREDRADALLCAYLGALAVLGRMEMLGSVEEGHIVVPRYVSPMFWPAPSHTLDLHGLTVLQAASAAEQFLRAQRKARAGQVVRLITGRGRAGGGAPIRTRVRTLLRGMREQGDVVREFELEETEGSFLVRLGG